jgi:hypothetical protein
MYSADTGVFPLVPFKCTRNPGINDDAMPAILLLSELCSLSIFYCSIGMITIHLIPRAVDVEMRKIASFSNALA